MRRKGLASEAMTPRLLRASAVAAVLTCVCLGTPLDAPSGASSAPPSSVATFVAAAHRALLGTFSEVYRLTGASSGIVELSQQAPSGVSPFPDGPGRWSFVYRSPTGISSQWIENGATAWDCWRFPHATSWTCSGPGQWGGSNGFALSVEPFVPGTLLGDLNELELGLKTKAPQLKGLEISESHSTQFGPLRCLRVDGVTSCIDHAGVVVRQRGGSSWKTLSLLQRSSSVPKAAFTLLGTSSSSGSRFTLVPV